MAGTAFEQLHLPDAGVVRFGPSTIKREEPMTTDTTADLAISLTIDEAQSLKKTIGIALANVGRKTSTLPVNSPARGEALRDYRHLLAIDAELSDAIGEVVK